MAVVDYPDLDHVVTLHSPRSLQQQSLARQTVLLLDLLQRLVLLVVFDLDIDRM